MATYRIVWSDPRGGTGEKIVQSAAEVDTWIDEFRDKGADAIKLTRDGETILPSELVAWMRRETPNA